MEQFEYRLLRLLAASGSSSTATATAVYATMEFAFARRVGPTMQIVGMKAEFTLLAADTAAVYKDAMTIFHITRRSTLAECVIKCSILLLIEDSCWLKS